jgi:Raf kinase inhibitor-like YbhB/YbcL family protein
MRLRAALALPLVALAGCGGGGAAKQSAPAAPAGLTVTSAAIDAGGTIPTEFTCSGPDRSPPLQWSGVPSKARELVLLVEDPDAPGGTFVHWTVSGIPPSVTESPEDGVPMGGTEGKNSYGRRGWRGPCPPEGDSPHRYRFFVYALGKPSGLHAGASPDDVHAAIAASDPLARGVLEARFGR